MNAVLDVQKLGGGQPAYYSDENYVLGLVNRGVKLEDAYDYANVGCGEPLIEGKQSNRPDGAAFINITKALEMALNDGKDPRTGRCLHKGKEHWLNLKPMMNCMMPLWIRCDITSVCM